MKTYTYGYTEGHVGDTNFHWICVEVTAASPTAGRASADTAAAAQVTHGGPLIFRYVFEKFV